ncbi:hydroxyectoine utilization dehydratase EutB [Rhodobaculum claviforme]|uniref:Hydroxyectoine utilization dehydratase EutB n=1 Tax=Rhodobaculum claviforme TaxID=1549854 RepID=A0A934TMC9_9RHOB|nr:hydroxyectoine utilization dehydratase EutB [Rhodobaculum claviforme]MBK5928121.1 hydroxyectoine utilization dehydratase EutB [Rhodobaculum claviforme]
MTVADILAARARIAPQVRRSFAAPSEALSVRVGAPVWLTHEHQQITGAFKLRGATNAVARLPAGTPGVVTASTGNHGRALAHAARARGLRAVVCLSHLVPENKRAAVRALGAEVRVIGHSQDDAQAEAARLAAEAGLALIPPFDHPDVIAGQGTLGLEMAEDVPDAAAVLIPLSGGGLFAGVATAMKALNPGIRAIGVSMRRGAAMAASLRAGHPVAVTEAPTLADSLGGGIGLDNRHTLDAVRALIDDVILLSEAEIAAGIRHLYHHERQIVEGGGAVGVAALLAGRITVRGPVLVPLTGANIDMALHARIIAGHDAHASPEDIPENTPEQETIPPCPPSAS